jgi:sugar lactone lactonase YvrE
MMGGEPFVPGTVALVAAHGDVRTVAREIAFPNGMAITPDDSLLIVADSYGKQLTAFSIGPDGSLADRRVWADLAGGVPDGICMDADGAVWYADVPNKRCLRVREGGAVLDTVEVDRGCFACMLGGPDGQTLFLVTREWHGTDVAKGAGSGQILATRAPSPHAGRP